MIIFVIILQHICILNGLVKINKDKIETYMTCKDVPEDIDCNSKQFWMLYRYVVRRLLVFFFFEQVKHIPVNLLAHFEEWKKSWQIL